MEQSLAGLDRAEVYKLLNCIVVPRPIAWITSIDEEGRVNLAPYSTFNIVCYDPPLLGVNVMAQPTDGRRKDTARNMLQRREFVIHIADEPMAEALNASAFAHPPQVSEVELLGLSVAASTDIRTPRLADAALALECRLHQVLQFGSGSEFLIGEVLRMHARDGLVRDNKIDSLELRPLARLGGPVYGTLGRTLAFPPARKAAGSGGG